MNKGPEDSPGWKDVAPEVKTGVVLDCRHCGVEIGTWHCADSGCCWCAECGANCKPPSKER